MRLSPLSLFSLLSSPLSSANRTRFRYGFRSSPLFSGATLPRSPRFPSICKGYGIWGALISNVGFVLRNIYSKKSLQSFKEVDGLNLYGWISIISLIYLFPVAVFVEGPQWVQGYRKAIESIGEPMTFYFWVMLCGVFHHLYNQSSYKALDEISSLTFSVGNTMKRVVVIVATVLVFRNPVRPLNALGSAIAIFGTFLYSQATAAQKAKIQEGEA